MLQYGGRQKSNSAGRFASGLLDSSIHEISFASSSFDHQRATHGSP